jgi:uncharacterized protein (DUF433 family)
MVVLTGVSSNMRKAFQALSSRLRANRTVVAVRSERQVQTRLTDAEVARLIAAYQAGAKINQLAIDFAINRNTVSSTLHSSDAAPPRRGLSGDDIAEAALLCLAGWSLAGIGNQFNCTAETVRQALHRTGVQRRNPWERPAAPVTATTTTVPAQSHVGPKATPLRSRGILKGSPPAI